MQTCQLKKYKILFACVNYESTITGMLDIEKIKSRRERVKLSQSQAAEAAGISRQRWNDIESGRKTNIELETLDAIAKALECKPKDLLK